MQLQFRSQLVSQHVNGCPWAIAPAWRVFVAERWTEPPHGTAPARAVATAVGQFAERYPIEDEVSRAIDTFGSWTQSKATPAETC